MKKLVSMFTAIAIAAAFLVNATISFAADNASSDAAVISNCDTVTGWTKDHAAILDPTLDTATVAEGTGSIKITPAEGRGDKFIFKYAVDAANAIDFTGYNAVSFRIWVDGEDTDLLSGANSQRTLILIDSAGTKYTNYFPTNTLTANSWNTVLVPLKAAPTAVVTMQVNLTHPSANAPNPFYIDDVKMAIDPANKLITNCDTATGWSSGHAASTQAPTLETSIVAEGNGSIKISPAANRGDKFIIDRKVDAINASDFTGYTAISFKVWVDEECTDLFSAATQQRTLIITDGSGTKVTNHFPTAELKANTWNTVVVPLKATPTDVVAMQLTIDHKGVFNIPNPFYLDDFRLIIDPTFALITNCDSADGWVSGHAASTQTPSLETSIVAEGAGSIKISPAADRGDKFVFNRAVTDEINMADVTGYDALTFKVWVDAEGVDLFSAANSQRTLRLRDINGKDYTNFFPTAELQANTWNTIVVPLKNVPDGLKVKTLLFDIVHAGKNVPNPFYIDDMQLVKHEHSLSYAASGSTVTATCTSTFPAACEAANGVTLTIDASACGKSYDGTASAAASVQNNITAAFADVTAGEITYVSTDNKGYSSTTPPTNAGAYKATVTIGGATAEAAFTIGKGTLTVTTEPTGKNGLTYSGNDQALANAGSANGGELQYSLDNQTWGISVPTGNAVQEYTVYWRVIGDDNHNDHAGGSFKVSIANASQSAPTGVNGVNETHAGQANGKLTGVNNTMEYRKDGESSYTAITGNEITGLATGIYYVRYAARIGYNASADTKITIGTGAKLVVTYVADGKTVSTQEVNYGENAAAPEIPAKAGHTAVGWNHDGKNITANITITAQYTVNKYTVTYVADGTTVSTQTVEYGANATAPAIPEKEGYTGAWDKDGANITADTTITAVYTAISASGGDDNTGNEGDDNTGAGGADSDADGDTGTGEGDNTDADADNITDTGVNSMVWLFVLLLVISGGVLAVIYGKKRAQR